MCRYIDTTLLMPKNCLFANLTDSRKTYRTQHFFFPKSGKKKKNYNSSDRPMILSIFIKNNEQKSSMYHIKKKGGKKKRKRNTDWLTLFCFCFFVYFFLLWQTNNFLRPYTETVITTLSNKTYPWYLSTAVVLHIWNDFIANMSWTFYILYFAS